MIYLNCNQLSSSGRLVSDINSVIFGNIKTEYRSDEDITLEYMLHSEIEASSRNWIGLYPKGATRLDQYITFEWTIVNPNNEARRHQNITFLAKYHVKKVEADKEYFFIFVNKHMKVVGSSTCFHFIIYHTFEFEEMKVPAKMLNSHSSTPESLKSLSEENLKTVMAQVIDKEIIQEFDFSYESKSKDHLCLSSTQMSDSIGQNINGLRADITITSPDFPISVNSSLSNNNINCCALCKRPSNFAEIEQSLNAKIKMYAEYGHTLEKRIEELERNVEMSQVAQKQLKLIAYHAKREKLSYQKFVNEMLSVLTNKGAVRILDGHGTELLLKRVDNTQSESKGLTYKKSQREEILKSVISSQESTIKDLTAQLKHYKTIKENLTDDKNKQTDHSELGTTNFEHLPKINNTVTLAKLPNTRSDEEKTENNNLPDSNLNESLNEFSENNYDVHLLNETYSLDNVNEPVSVILPPDDFRQPKKQLEDVEKNEKMSSLKNDGQGDYHGKRTTASSQNICELKQNVMKELRNAIRKRQDKAEHTEIDHSGNTCDETFNISVNETVQSMHVEDSNALIIKGEHLQYAIIRIQKSP